MSKKLKVKLTQLTDKERLIYAAPTACADMISRPRISAREKSVVRQAFVVSLTRRESSHAV